MIDSRTVQIALGVYAALLVVGGFVGFVKARSWKSLYAGLLFGAAVAICLGIVLAGGQLGYYLGIVLVLHLFIFFAVRLVKTRKFMPAGLMTLVSLAMLALLGVRLFGSLGA